MYVSNCTNQINATKFNKSCYTAVGCSVHKPIGNVLVFGLFKFNESCQSSRNFCAYFLLVLFARKSYRMLAQGDFNKTLKASI